MNIISNIISLFVVIASLIAFVWLVIGVIPGFYFLYKIFVTNDQKLRRKYFKQFIISFGGIVALIGLSIFYAVVSLTRTFLGS